VQTGARTRDPLYVMSWLFLYAARYPSDPREFVFSWDPTGIALSNQPISLSLSISSPDMFILLAPQTSGMGWPTTLQIAYAYIRTDEVISVYITRSLPKKTWVSRSADLLLMRMEWRWRHRLRGQQLANGWREWHTHYNRLWAHDMIFKA
jgi:hypothetical protein